MRSALRVYSDILKLRTEAFTTLKYASGGMRYAVGLFITVALVAGLGLWVGLPALLQKPLLVDRIDQASALVDRIDQEVVPAVNASLDAISQENLSLALEELMAEGGTITSETLSQLVARAGVSAQRLRQAVMTEASSLSAEARAQVETQMAAVKEQLQTQGVVPPEQIDRLLAQSSLTADQVAGYLARVPGVQSQVERLRAQVVQEAPRLEQLLGQIPVTPEQVRALLTRLALSPERLKTISLRLGLTPEQLSSLRANIDELPEEVNAILDQARAGAEELQPPLGSRFSRAVHMFGQWLSTPLQLMAQWALFALVLLIAAKLIGGRGTVRQHIIAVLLASAPLVLLFFTYVPNVAPAMSASMTLAFDVFGRILALVGIAWAGLILLKAIAVTHEFGMWRAAGAVALAWAIIYVIAPVVSFLAIGYILRG